MIINVDLDGVIYDFVADARAEYERTYHDPFTPDPTHWAIWEQWRIYESAMDDDEPFYLTKNKFWKLIDRGIEEGRVYGGGEERLIRGAREGLKALHKAGHHIRIVTSKAISGRNLRHQAIRNVLNFLNETGIYYDEICFVKGNKLDFRADVVIDDKPDLGAWVQPNAINMLFVQPWNESEAIPAQNFLPVRGWNEVVKELANTISRLEGPHSAECVPRESTILVKNETTVRKTILDTARELVYGDRQDAYGHPRDNFGHTAAIWSAYHGTDFTPEDVAAFMVMVKMSREHNVPKTDNRVDMAGYVATWDRVVTGD